MTISDELTRIQTAKADIKASIEAKGVTVPSDALINQYADYVDEIQTGGGGGNEDLIDLIERDITSITIPSGTTKIGEYVFYNCSGLTSITIPNSVTSIGNYAFQSCTSLTNITIPESVTSIGIYAFSNSGLTSITIPNTTKYFSNCFIDCKSLPSVYIPYDGVVNGFNNNTFMPSNYNYTIFYIPQNHLNSYKSKFTSTKNIFLSYPRVNNHSEIVMNCSVSSNKNVKLFRATTQITKVYLDNVEQEITDTYYMTAGEHTVRAEIYDSRIVPHNLAKEIDKSCDIDMILPNGIEIIPDSTFYSNGNLKSINIPNSVTEIDYYIFSYSSSLTDITIGSGVTSIGDSAFSGCSKLTSVTINATTPPSLGSSAFSGTNANLIIYVPAASLEAYKTATNWKNVSTRIQAIPTE